MESLFFQLLDMSITASWLVLAVFLFRLIFKKAPKWINCLLWGLVAVRLIFPFSIESVLSLIPSAKTIPSDIVYSPKPQINSGYQAFNNYVNPVINEAFAPEVTESVNPLQLAGFIATCVWLAGVAAMVLYAVISYLRIRNRVREAVEDEKGIMYCDSIDTPFILGVFNPKIYLPSAVNEADVSHVINHEKAHIKRKDYIWKPLGFALMSVYWFNPVMWVAYILLCRDIELACDEKVLKETGTENKKLYAEALLNCSVKRRNIAACPLAFGEVGVKARIKSVLNYKKPAFWVVLLAVLVSVGVAVAFMTDPKVEEQNEVPPTENLTAIEKQQAVSEYEGVSVEIKGIDTKNAFLDVEWKNQSDKQVTFGEEFYIYKRLDNGEWANCRIGGYAWTCIGYPINTGDTAEKRYSLYNINMTEPGAYRFVTHFTVYYDVTPYSLTVDFEITEPVAQKSYAEAFPVIFYKEPTAETKTPEYYAQSAFYGEEMTDFLKKLEDNNWFDGCILLADRATFFFDGEIRYGDTLRFGFEQKVIAYGDYWCDMEEEEIAILKEHQSNASYGLDIVTDEAITDEATDFSPIIDEVSYDIDGDGIEEECTLSYGPTSGLFTFIFFVYENGELEYFNIFHSQFLYLNFKTDQSGKLYIRGETQDELPTVFHIDVGISQDDNIVLTCGEEQLSYWGEQGITSMYVPFAQTDEE